MERKCLILLLWLAGVALIFGTAPPVFAELRASPDSRGYFKCWACSGRGVDSQGNPCTYCGGSGVRNIHQMRQGSSYGEYRGYRNPGSSCFVATAAYGSPWHKNVYKLRCFRDSYLLTNSFGKRLVGLYYRHSPPVADAIRNRPWARSLARITLTPFVIVAGAFLGNISDLILLGMLLFGCMFIVVKIAKKVRRAKHRKVVLGTSS